MARPKRGFTSPISQWIKTSDWIQRPITDAAFYGHGLLDQALARQMLEDHLAARRDWARQLWLVFVFNHWWYTHGRP